MSDSSKFATALAQSIGAQQAFKVAIVAAVHIQPTKNWIDALDYLSKSATIIIVDDSNGKVDLPDNWDVYDYARQKEILGEDMYSRFEVFHKSSSCKTFGLWLAYNRGFDPIIVIDSDCVVPPDFIARHMDGLLSFGQGWENPIQGSGYFSRGFPMHERAKPVWAHMGLWENELDLYGTDRVEKPNPPKLPPRVDRPSTGAFFPLSGMNLSFRNEAAPFMMFLPNFGYTAPDVGATLEKFSRHDDIWGGYIFQKVAKAKGFAVTYGDPNVFHETIVIPEEDAAEEVAMIKYEKQFYNMIDDALIHSLWWGYEKIDPTAVYDDIAEHIEKNGGLFTPLLPVFEFAGDMFADKEQL